MSSQPLLIGMKRKFNVYGTDGLVTELQFLEGMMS